MGWFPTTCVSCQQRKSCQICYNGVKGLRQMNRDSALSQIWEIFNHAKAISTFDPEVGYNLLGVHSIIASRDDTLNCSVDDFWQALTYFLYRTNAKHRAGRASRKAREDLKNG